MTTLRTDQKFAKWLLPCVQDQDKRTEGNLCMVYRILLQTYSADQIREAAKVVHKKSFVDWQDLLGYMRGTLRGILRRQQEAAEPIYEDRIEPLL